MSELPRRIKQAVKQPWRLAVPLKRLVIVVLFLIVAVIIYAWAFDNVWRRQDIAVTLVALWLVTAYFLLPRAHRFLTGIYVPNYFIGRARTSDGLLADPVNMAIRGSEEKLTHAMAKAGWSTADPITIRSALRIVFDTLRRSSYTNAPVSDLYVFGAKQELAYQKEVDGNPAKRHHVRFWRVPKGMYLPGGHRADWVAAASYDDAVGVSLFTLQITHSIDGDVDAERDFVAQTIKDAEHAQVVEKIEHFFPGYHHRNGGGSKFFTDGSMVIVELK